MSPDRKTHRVAIGEKAEAPARTRSHAGFTLIELLVVIGLIAGVTAFLIGGLRDHPATSLQSAQATLANLLTAARTRAMASGQTTRLLLNIDEGSGAQPARFLRFLVVQQQDPAGNWHSITRAYLPSAVYVVPGNFGTISPGLFPVTSGASPWIRADGDSLRSTAFRNNQISSEAIDGSTVEKWVGILLSPSGNTAQSGDIIVAVGRIRPPGSYASGDSPVELLNADAIRGLAVSQYGVAALINSRSGF